MKLFRSVFVCAAAASLLTACIGGAHKRVSPRVYELYATGEIEDVLERLKKEQEEAEDEARAEAGRLAESMREAIARELRRSVGDSDARALFEGFLESDPQYRALQTAVETLEAYHEGGSVSVERLRSCVETVSKGYAFDARQEIGERIDDPEFQPFLEGFEDDGGEGEGEGGGGESDDTDESEEDPLADGTQLGFELNTVELARTNLELGEALKKEIDDVEKGSAKYLVSHESFYSVGSVVAFDNDLEATAIPIVAYNTYPFADGKWETLGVQAVFGGALSGGNGSTDLGLAVGGGFFVPVGKSGSLSLGHVLWDEDGDGENGWYIGINIGASAQSTSKAP